MKSNTDLVAHAISKLGSAYMFGYTGIVTEEAIQRKANQYPRMYTITYIIKCRKNIGRWATDCSGLIDIFLGVDLSSSGYYARALKKGPISTIPKNIPGLLVFKTDTTGDIYHVGVCVGDGTVVEAKGIDYGVVRTTLANAGWDLWAYCHLISYDGPQEDTDVIQKGSEGEVVKAWQRGLLKLGFALPVYGDDGDFGSETTAATIEFQTAQGLEANGIVNDICWGKMALALMAIPADTSALENQIGDLKLQLVTSQEVLDRLNDKYDELVSGLRTVAKHISVV